MENDITLTSSFIINPNKSKIIIDGTYNNVKSTYTNNLESLEENYGTIIDTKAYSKGYSLPISQKPFA